MLVSLASPFIMHPMKKSSYVLVGMSGGVDSSIAAYLLKEAGMEVEGVFMKNWQEDDTSTFCSAEKDFADAQAVCDQLQIKLHFANFSDQYWQRVFIYFLEEYARGRTPNPDILCNKEIKFLAFLDYAQKKGATAIATGHYARLKREQNKTFLLKGKDHTKDQSYFLSALNQQQLTHSLFPIGHLNKQEVRALAKKMNFKNHNKKDSTGICFIGERPFKSFLQNYLPAKPGPIQNLDGEELGQHDGLLFYTIGQRQGIKLGGQKNKLELAWYVAEKDIPNNILKVVQGNEHPALFKMNLTTSKIHWINETPTLPFSCFAKTRYRQEDQACIIDHLNEDHYQVSFLHAQRAITPGQQIVFYQEEVCLGSAMIES